MCFGLVENWVFQVGWKSCFRLVKNVFQVGWKLCFRLVGNCASGWLKMVFQVGWKLCSRIKISKELGHHMEMHATWSSNFQSILIMQYYARKHLQRCNFTSFCSIVYAALLTKTNRIQRIFNSAQKSNKQVVGTSSMLDCEMDYIIIQ